MENHLQYQYNELEQYSPFNIYTGGTYPFVYYLDISSSCVTSHDDSVILSGGWSTNPCSRCSYKVC